MERRIINPWTWQDQMGYVEANEVYGVQRTLLCAGQQTSVDEEGRPVHAGDMGAQLAQSLDNLQTVLGAAGAALSDVMRLSIYTTDVDLFFEAYGPAAARLAEAGCRPASTLLGVTTLAFPELLVEIEATAVVWAGDFLSGSRRALRVRTQFPGTPYAGSPVPEKTSSRQLLDRGTCTLVR